jgi:glycosyltransferase involved in cell wall biosynthesis
MVWLIEADLRQLPKVESMLMKQNVLQLIGSFHEGGSERQAVQLARLLKENGRYGVHIACLDASGTLRGEVERLGVGKIPEFPLTSFYDRNAFNQLRRFARFLREREVSVVHTHDFYTNVFGMAGAALARVPVRIASRRETTGWRSDVQKFVERRAYDLAHKVITNAEAVRDQLISEGVRKEKTLTIYNSLDLERVSAGSVMRRNDALAMFNLPAENNIQLVTIVANLRHKVKNHSMFLRAARTVSQALPRTGFVVAGEGELMTSLRAMAEELGLTDKVYFIGRCDRVGELLALSDVCVLSSTAEGFSNSILEYMAAARPVVATDVGGAREAIVDSQTGYLVRSDDCAAMAERIVDLLRNPHMASAMGKRGRQIIEERFSCEAQLEKTQDLYARLLARARPIRRKALKRDSKVSLEAQR